MISLNVKFSKFIIIFQQTLQKAKSIWDLVQLIHQIKFIVVIPQSFILPHLKHKLILHDRFTNDSKDSEYSDSCIVSSWICIELFQFVFGILNELYSSFGKVLSLKYLLRASSIICSKSICEFTSPNWQISFWIWKWLR